MTSSGQVLHSPVTSVLCFVSLAGVLLFYRHFWKSWSDWTHLCYNRSWSCQHSFHRSICKYMSSFGLHCTGITIHGSHQRLTFLQHIFFYYVWIFCALYNVWKCSIQFLALDYMFCCLCYCLPEQFVAYLCCTNCSNCHFNYNGFHADICIELYSVLFFRSCFWWTGPDAERSTLLAWLEWPLALSSWPSPWNWLWVSSILYCTFVIGFFKFNCHSNLKPKVGDFFLKHLFTICSWAVFFQDLLPYCQLISFFS